MSRRNVFFRIAVLPLLLSAVITVPASASGWAAEDPVSQAAVLTVPPQKEEPFSHTWKEEVIGLVNGEREKVGLSPLEAWDTLESMADIRAQETACLFSHTRPDGSDLSTLFQDYGLDYSAAAENLAYGYTNAAALVQAWMDSESHRSNLLSDRLTRIGIGCFQSQSGTLYVTQLFCALPAAQAEDR